MTWLCGASGERIELVDPYATEIRLSTIAHALANICRWGGHVRHFYSVASHSLHVSRLLEATHGIEGARVGLLHDAHEAYTGDIPAPLKEVLGSTWTKFEARWLSRVYDHFNLPAPHELVWAACKRADLVALATERKALMPPGFLSGALAVESELPAADEAGIGPGVLHLFAPTNIEQWFLARAAELGLS